MSNEAERAWEKWREKNSFIPSDWPEFRAAFLAGYAAAEAKGADDAGVFWSDRPESVIEGAADRLDELNLETREGRGER